MSQISSQKRLLTMFTNTLERLVGKLSDEKYEKILWDENSSKEAMQDVISKLEEGITALDCASTKVEKHLRDYAVIIDQIAGSSSKELEEYEAYASRAETTIGKAFDLNMLLQAQVRAAISLRDSSSAQSIEIGAQPRMSQLHTKQLELPPLPVPTFSGNLWEWENFWELYNTNIHSQNLPEMVKYNYLINALQGSAKESIKKFQLTKGNYEKVIQFLLNKYNDRDLLINQLVDQLDKCALRSPSIKDQRSLLEEIQAIVTQLKEKGENIDSSWLVKKVLSKFPARVMRKIIARKKGTSEAPFQMRDLMQYLDDYLSTEEMCTAYIGERPATQQSPFRYNNLTKKTVTANAKCMYCQGDHASYACTTFPTPQARSQYLRQKQLCLLCASSTHKTLQCRRRPCFYCKAAHHSSCCYRQQYRKGNQQERRDESMPKRPEHSATTKKPPEKTKKINKAATSVNSNQVVNNDEEEHYNSNKENQVLQLQAVLHTQNANRSLLPAGEITVLDTKTNTLRKVDILFDSGAEVSFIDSSLADDLRLPVLGQEKMKLHTFGSRDIHTSVCELVQLDTWDAEGKAHVFRLHTHDIFTKAFSPPRVSETDRKAIRVMNLSVQYLDTNKELIKPSILLGCDQMWTLFRTDVKAINLPSGLMLLPTKLGYVISGQPTSPPRAEDHQVLQVSPYTEEMERWNNYWSMDIQVNTVQPDDSQIPETEEEKWENYWTLDVAGTEPFMGPTKEAREALDKKVWEHFNETIEKREDGYYVRLPWKEQYQYLPDNYAIAFRRLVNVWSSLRKDDTLLEQYNGVFRDQLEKNILEEVDTRSPATGSQIHYIPHQPVWTPNKTTTKLRIVFDASAHYKGSSSLNEALHRGPVILPSLYGLLLRFRIGAIALLSDVEKAFLQVRLHESDRDATRCLWLQDHKMPPDKSNLRVLRFTRVTFGIKSSPFLLAATTRHHLDKYQDEPFSQEIRDNIYVDNLILTSDTCEESIQLYMKPKKIFSELGMNLREFASNSTNVMEAIAQSDKATAKHLKVLGVAWDHQTDAFNLLCSIPESSTVTKRTITSAIASVYDPLGWFVPLLHKARVFLQQLWRDQYDWDTQLTSDKVNEWKEIRDNIHGFRRDLPRVLSSKAVEAILVTFADASTSGMTACTYLFQPQSRSAHLLMARSKLPSLHGQATIPKLELNAVTLAMRLSNAVVSQLEKVLRIQTIYVFSDSEIALSWIKKEPQREAGIFVHNRLLEIRRISEHLREKEHQVRLGYVATKDNPADCGTRGLTSEGLGNHFWWTGPWFLQEHPRNWPTNATLFDMPQDDSEELLYEEIQHQASIAATTTISPSPSDEVEIIRRGHARTFTKAKRILAYVLRFLSELVLQINKKGNTMMTLSILRDTTISRQSRYLNGRELDLAGRVLIKHHQDVWINNNITKSMRRLNPQPDAEGILRCYGRLGQAQMDVRAIYPILILQKTVLADEYYPAKLGRVIRRPINLLVPLELEDEPNSKPEESLQTQSIKNEEYDESSTPRYNLRRRKRMNYNEEGDNGDILPNSMAYITSFLQIAVVCVLVSLAGATTKGDNQSLSTIRTITCTERGVQLHLPGRYPYEVCAEHYCVDARNPQESTAITFPADVMLHEHKVRWKILLPYSMEIIESICPPAPFCPSIDCTFCSNNIFNPECWPVSAIIATATIVYFVITGCYVFLYVTLTVGRPLRVLTYSIWVVLKTIGRHLAQRLTSQNRRAMARRRHLAEILAILTVLAFRGQGCQLVNVVNHQSTICSVNHPTYCQIQLSEIFKINSFKREACIRLSINNTTLHDVHMRWKLLDLLCEPETDYLTRDTVHRVVDSKRCAHMGSCVGEKCGSINSSSLIPELEKGNHLPGNTACMESCGGPGCDCLAPSSGCLFYRIYMEPVDGEIFEIFHCNRWTEAAEIEVSHFDKTSHKSSTITIRMIPNIPTTWKFFSFTLTSLGVPPLPLLGNRFVSNSKTTALWKTTVRPVMRCPTHSDAENLNCSVIEDCTCLPAETRVICKCKDFPVGPWVNDVKNQLPVEYPSVLFRKHETARVQAKVTGLVTSEIIMNFFGNLTTEILVDDALCHVTTTQLTGCYNCAKGAFTQATCYSSRNNIDAEVVCEQVGFTIPCNITGVTSTLRFATSKAQAILSCSISCGTVSTSFQVGGILKFTASLHGMLEQWLKGDPSGSSELAFPDFFHIAEVFMQWYKTSILAAIGLLLAIMISYLFLSTLAFRILKGALLLIPRLLIRILIQIVCVPWSRKQTAHNKQR